MMQNKFIISYFIIFLGLAHSTAQNKTKSNALPASERHQQIDQYWTDRAAIQSHQTIQFAPLSLTYVRPASV